MALKKTSVFDLNQQSTNIDSKIVVALEKVSEIFRTLQWQYAQPNNISPVQLQIMVFIRYHNEELCTVGNLAKNFNITKATVSDSVKTLLKKNLIQKKIDAADSRSFRLGLTSGGEDMIEQIERYPEAIQTPVQELDIQKKEAMLDGLMGVIHELYLGGTIETQRMCFTCSHYKGDYKTSHQCNLLKKKLPQKSLRLDCPEHLKIVR